VGYVRLTLDKSVKVAESMSRVTEVTINCYTFSNGTVLPCVTVVPCTECLKLNLNFKKGKLVSCMMHLWGKSYAYCIVISRKYLNLQSVVFWG